MRSYDFVCGETEYLKSVYCKTCLDWKKENVIYPSLRNVN